MPHPLGLGRDSLPVSPTGRIETTGRLAYCGGMNELLSLSPGEIVLLQSPPQEFVLTLIAALAVESPLMVLDANNQFDAYRVARLIRRRTANLDPVLDRVFVARAFTCYQVVALFEQAAPTPMAHVVLDLLATFNDESVSLEESQRLLQHVLGRARVLSRHAPVIISARPPRAEPRRGLLAAVAELADHCLLWDAPPAPIAPRLF